MNVNLKVAKVNIIAGCFLIFTFLACQREVSLNLEEECVLNDLVIDTGECTSDSTYKLTINFKYQHTGSDFFDVFVRNNQKVGSYKLSDLPITIDQFKRSGNDFDFIKIVIKDKPGCFLVAEFKPPVCEERKCTINELRTDVGECHSDGTYDLTINFNHHNAGNQYFNVYTRDGKLIGTYKLTSLPITINNFKRSGNDHDFIKVVINDREDCFAVAEFKPPVCEERKCAINELRADIGECYADGTYNLTINFNHHNAGNEYFNVYTRDGKLTGTYKLANLPITLNNFKRSGNDHDYIKVVINDREDCYAVAEFKPPVCEERKCTINELRADIGECTSDSTYNLTINFNHQHAGNEYFDVFIRDNKRIGTYKLSELPLTIKNFKLSGRDYEFIHICINDQADCCKAIEFIAPKCGN